MRHTWGIVGCLLLSGSVPALAQEQPYQPYQAPQPTTTTSGPTEEPKQLDTVELRAGFSWVSRRFFYTDNFKDRLRTYDMGLAPAPFADAEWYPGGDAIGSPSAHLGLVGHFEKSMGWTSKRASGERFDTSGHEWQLGVRGRMPVLPHQIGASLTYGNQAFEVDDDPRSPLVPDVSYKFLRLGFDARARFDEFSLGGHLAYRFILDAGAVESDEWFPRTSVGGLDLGAFVGYGLADEFDILAGVDYRRYFYTLNPEPGDRRVAGGALDQFVSLWLGLGYRIP